MARQSIPKLLSVGALGLLVLIFGVVLLLIAAPMFVPHGGFVFAISRRAFTVAIVASLTIFAVVLFFVARAFRRRHLK
jgi:hypothetical protein